MYVTIFPLCLKAFPDQFPYILRVVNCTSLVVVQLRSCLVLVVLLLLLDCGSGLPRDVEAVVDRGPFPVSDDRQLVKEFPKPVYVPTPNLVQVLYDVTACPP